MVKELLPLVTKLTRYLGNEVNSVHKDLRGVDLTFALAFPDVYEIGMSYVGFQILYDILNKREDIAAERVYAPWVDMEELLRTKGILLSSLESSLPLKDFNIVGFTLPYELSYTNILNMLDLSGIPFLAKDRDKSWPLIIAGGSCAFNPEPVADFFDAIVLGDGEEVILELCNCFKDWKKNGGEKEALYRNLSKIQGVYIPSFFDITYHSNGTIEKIVPLRENYSTIKKRVVSDLNSVDYPTKLIVPFMKIIHDRVSLEIARGCTRGCRFCQAGMTYRPVRERSEETIKNIVKKAIDETGQEEISLLSLNTGDYSCISDLMADLMCRYSEENIAVSLPSLRPETLTPELIKEIKKVRKTGITIAPEAGTQKLRDTINKGITEEEILATTKNVFASGWKSIKLYFMIGLPTEKEEDVEGIVELSRKILSCGKGLNSQTNINVSVSTFVPKPQTPFQWESQISLKEMLEKHRFLKSKLSGKGLSLKWQDPKLSILEGTFSRGDRRLSSVLINAQRYGCRLDGWSEHFRYDLWEKAFRDARLEMDFYNRRKLNYDEVLPWYHLDCLVNKEFLAEERKRGLNSLLTPDCRIGGCTNCGVCDNKDIKLITSSAVPQRKPLEYLNRQQAVRFYRKYRLQFSKLDDARFLSHLELISVFSRALRRAKIPVRYSKGFHPLPRIIFGGALPVCIESLSEYVDIEIEGYITSDEFKDKLNKELPSGLRVLNCWEIILKSNPISDSIRKIKYLVFTNEQIRTIPPFDNNLKEAVASFLSKDSLFVLHKKKGGMRKVDLRFMVEDVKLRDNLSFEIIIRPGMAMDVKPFKLVEHILNLEDNQVKLLKILRAEAELGK
ncbi:MAG: TIGR03960 family B12-binding radical SAM protein [Thermodesulfobacteriota bacterium]